MIWIKPRTTDDRGQPSRVANHADLKAAGISHWELGLPLPGGKEFTTKKQATKHHWSSLIVFIGPTVWLWVFSSRFANAIRPTGRCVRCLYDMSQCPIEDDDCRICPECGSAWKIELAQPRLSL